MRCTVCGRLPDEEHCPPCHENHDRLRESPIWAVAKSGNQIVPGTRKRRIAGNVVAVK